MEVVERKRGVRPGPPRIGSQREDRDGRSDQPQDPRRGDQPEGTQWRRGRLTGRTCPRRFRRAGNVRVSATCRRIDRRQGLRRRPGSRRIGRRGVTPLRPCRKDPLRRRPLRQAPRHPPHSHRTAARPSQGLAARCAPLRSPSQVGPLSRRPRRQYHPLALTSREPAAQVCNILMGIWWSRGESNP